MTSEATAEPDPVGWRAIPNSSQRLAVMCPANEVLLSGPRGWGKTAAQLISFRKHVKKGYGEFWRGIIFDRKHDDLKGLVQESRKIFGKFNDGAKFFGSAGLYKWRWPTGEELLFRHAFDAKNYWTYHGEEWPFFGASASAR